MDLLKVVNILDHEFNIDDVKDDWSYLFDQMFIRKSVPFFRGQMHNTGLMISNSNEVNKIYTAFSPSRYILEEIQMKGIVNSLLVVKHPFDWDGRKNGMGFIPFTQREYQLMEGMGISIYSLNILMDKNRNDLIVSTAYAFAKVIKLKVEEEFGIEGKNNPDLLLGVIGKVQEKKLSALVKRISKILDYKVKLRKVSDEVGRVAIVTGGGFGPELVREAKEKGVTTYITGIITPNASKYSRDNYAKNLSEINKLGVNVLGCSRYLTEKFSMEYSLPYFSKILKSEFIEDKEALKILE